jgi:hypothetical protein
MTPRRIASAILILGSAVMLAMNAPGQLSYDSVEQLADGRAGFYNSWHPPVMAWLLGLFDRLVPGTLLFLVFQGLMLLSALLALLWLKPRGWSSVALAAAMVLMPQWLLYQGEIWKDMLFADAAIAGFAALAVHAQTRKPAGLVLAAVLLALAVSARQNGLILLPVAAVTCGLIARRQDGSGWRQPWHQPWRQGVFFLAAVLALAGALNLALASRTDGGEGANAELRRGQSYDLAGALARDPGLVLPLNSDPGLEGALRTRGRALYSPLQSDAFAADPAISQALSNASDGTIATAWQTLVLRHTLLYFRTRWADFAALVTSPDPIACHLVSIGVSGSPAQLKQLGLVAGNGPRAQALGNYSQLFVPTPVFSHLAWGALAMVLMVILIRRGEPADLVMSGLLASALLFAMTFFFISIACDYRYLVFLDLSAMASALYLVKKT